MMTLVTGGLGLIGHQVVRRLECQNHPVVILDTQTNYGAVDPAELEYLISERKKQIKTTDIYHTDVADAAGVGRLMAQYSPEVVIHLASYPRQKLVNQDPAQASRTMIQGLLNMLEASVRHGVKKFVYISSSMVYGDFTDNIQEDAECRPQGQYGIMKLAGEWLVKDYTRRCALDHVILRPSAVYGPLDVSDRVISKFLLTARLNGTLRVNGAAETLDFTYVDDAADGVVAAALDATVKNQTYNITKSHSWSLLDAANLAVRIVGRGRVVIGEKDADFPSRGALSIERARRDFGFDPKVDIEEGFQRYHAWITDSIYWSKKTV